MALITSANIPFSASSTFFPNSHCSSCNRLRHSLEVIPLYRLLRTRCHQCKKRLRGHYPCIEIASILISWGLAWHLGASWILCASLILSWSLLALAVIDAQHQLLPDCLTLPLLWLGLLCNTQYLFTSPIAAIWGGCIGYLFLWAVYWLFKLLTKKEGIGYGDFKLLAALGAWYGWTSLPIILLISSLLGSIFGVFFMFWHRQHHNTPIAFGPWIAFAGLSMTFLQQTHYTAEWSILQRLLIH